MRENMSKNVFDFIKECDDQMSNYRLKRISKTCQKNLLKELENASDEYLFFLISKLNYLKRQASLLTPYLSEPLIDTVAKVVIQSKAQGYVKRKYEETLESGNSIQLEYLFSEYFHPLYVDEVFYEPLRLHNKRVNK